MLRISKIGPETVGNVAVVLTDLPRDVRSPSM